MYFAFVEMSDVVPSQFRYPSLNLFYGKLECPALQIECIVEEHFSHPFSEPQERYWSQCTWVTVNLNNFYDFIHIPYLVRVGLVRDAQPSILGRRSQSRPRRGTGCRFPAGEPEPGPVQGRHLDSWGGQVLGVEEGK